MKKTPLSFLAILFFFFIFSQALTAQNKEGILTGHPEKYSRVRIFTDDEGLRRLGKSGVTIDHGNYRKGVFFESDFSEREILKIKNSGMNHEIIIDDVSEFYRSQNEKPANKNEQPSALAGGCGSNPAPAYAIPSNFTLGSMGGYFTYNEFLSNIDSMASKYPSLIKAKMPIDTFKSIQGKDIYWLKISDNPSVDESEPEVMYTALHHAREPGSLSQLIFYMWYILENYGTDQDIKNLVDNTEMYFVPMVNPDGYIYNQTTNPNGGGMWRKNRRNIGGGEFGIDINRNYGYMWGLDDSGSSPDPADDTYRGTSGFSEPETRAVKFFCEAHDFKIVLNYHTYGNLFIYPWGFDYSIYTPDSAVFVNYAQWMTRHNNYNYGTGDQTVGYITNGDSDDWMYGEQTSKNKILSCTPEVGAADLGFWPPSSSIIDLCEENMTQNITMALLVGKYAKAKETSPKFITNLDGYFPFTIQRLGLDSPASFTVQITPVGNEINSIGGSKIFSSLSLLEEQTDSISYSLDTTIQPGSEIKFIISVSNGVSASSDTISKNFGNPASAFIDNGNNLSNFTGDWGLSNTIYHSPSSSITDSPGGDYSNNSVTTTELSQPVNLSNSIDALLTFWTRWQIEPGWDYVQVLASSDNGSTWVPLCGKYTHPGNSNQDTGQPLYDGMQLNWVFEEMSLKDFTGSNVLIKFQLTSDNWSTFDGFYFDDLRVETIDTATVGISRNLKDNYFISASFPNPASGQVNISYSIPQDEKNATLHIYNYLGEKVLYNKLSEGKRHIQIDISGISPGIYFYGITSDGFRSEEKKMTVVK